MLKLVNKNIDGISIEKGLDKFFGDEEMYLNILRLYASSTRSLLASIGTVKESELEDYRIAVHNIKGISLDIFAEWISKFAADLEGAAKVGDFKYIEKHNSSFIEAAQKLVCDIEDVLSAINAENPKPEKDSPDKELLSKLLTACEAYDMDGVDEAMEEIEVYQYKSDNDLVNWLRENVDDMNFKQIVERLSKI